jgi:hypothetical protein
MVNARRKHFRFFTVTVSSVLRQSPYRHKGECVDHGNWTFSNDDVRGQEDDVQNNFGQAGFFTHAPFNMYPKRAISSSKCEFC